MLESQCKQGLVCSQVQPDLCRETRLERVVLHEIRETCREDSDISSHHGIACQCMDDAIASTQLLWVCTVYY